MQTFLPWICLFSLSRVRRLLADKQYEQAVELLYWIFRWNLAMLDYRRLGKQRVEAKQLIDALTSRGSQSWNKHPCAKMWRGHVTCLCLYQKACIDEWKDQGFNNTMIPHEIDPAKVTIPSWLGWHAFHKSHRSNLRRKDPDFYSCFDVPTDLDYIWPDPDE